MQTLVKIVWLIPVIPLVGAAILSLTPQRQRRLGGMVAITALGISFILSLAAFLSTLGKGAEGSVVREFINFPWLQIGTQPLQLGWLLDPLTASMLVMVTFVGLLIFIYSTGYMAEDPNVTRFFCFLSLFAAAMLGVLISNSLLLLFICWELVGLASYLLIGFWYEKPSAAAAAKKAFITTRIGDLGLFLGMLWLYSQTGTLLFYDHGQNGCLEQSSLTRLVSHLTVFGMVTSTAISLLIFFGASGKSGQVPLHVWLPDAMEGPTPVSALIHAATMVAAGVFLLARVYPLLDADPGSRAGLSTALTIIAWVGAITAVFAASIAVAQTDIKRILAYSTISQLGFMMLGLGVGGVAVAMFHLMTHAFFKALLFLGAGSVIHGCHGEQDIRKMGGLKRWMPVTFATYMVGMVALSGVPLISAGFWSKDEILHSAMAWSVARGPFYLGVVGALLTAFYMTRQICYVFFGSRHEAHAHGHNAGAHDLPHESPRVMTVPLATLAAFTILGSFFGTPAWPWFQSYLTGEPLSLDLGHFFHGSVLLTLLLSTIIVGLGIGAGWKLYGNDAATHAEADVLEQRYPNLFSILRDRFYVDELYEKSVIRLSRWLAKICDFLDRTLWNGIVRVASTLVLGLSWLDRWLDNQGIDRGFDETCRNVRRLGRQTIKIQDGQVQHYLRILGMGLAVLVLIFAWGWMR